MIIMNDILFAMFMIETFSHSITLKKTTSMQNQLSRFKKEHKAKTTLFRFPGLRQLEMNVFRRE